MIYTILHIIGGNMKLLGKNILFLGSSVTYGSAAGGVSFVEIMAEKCGYSYIKEAVSGTTLADINEKSYVSRLKKLGTDFKADLFVCQLSTNDASRAIPLTEVEDAIRFIVEYTRINFVCPIVFYTNPYYDSENYMKMVDLVNKLSKELGFYVLDLYNDAKMRELPEELYKQYMADRIHPTYKGYKEWLTPEFIKFFDRI